MEAQNTGRNLYFLIEIMAQELYNGYGSCSEGTGKDDDDGDIFVFGGINIPLDKGWSYRIDPPNPNKGEQRHAHVENPKRGEWSQNEDGSKHKGKSNDGTPPNKVKDKLKDKAGWDWDKNAENNKQKNEDKNKKIDLPPIPPVIFPAIKEGAFKIGTAVESRISIFLVPKYLFDIWMRSMPGYDENKIY